MPPIATIVLLTTVGTKQGSETHSCVCVYRLPHTNKQYLDATECLSIWLNFDTTCPEIESDSTGKVLSPTSCSCLVTKSYLTLWPHGLQQARLPCPSLFPRVCSDSCPLSRWCYLTISSSAAPFSLCLQSFAALVFSNELALRIRWPKYWSFNFSISPFSESLGLLSFRMDCFALLSLHSKGLSRVFSNTTVQKHQFFSTQLS